jgi:tetratricopeptide (TPR) repeat protein
MPAPAPAAGLDDLAFDDFSASKNPFLPEPTPSAAPPPPPPSFSEPAGEDWNLAPAAPSAASSAPSFDDLGFSAPPPSAAPAAPPPPAPSAGPAVDPRITEFLSQGDKAYAQGRVQEAIDTWSRVFLIDLSNDEASQRIDEARVKLEDSARRIDILISEGIQLFDAGDLANARHKFLDVLALSEHDATARNYLNQIDAALTPKGPTPDSFGASSDFMKSELEAPGMPSFAPSDMGRSSRAPAPSLDDAGFEPSPRDEASMAAQEEELGEHEVPEPAPRGRFDARILIGVALLFLLLVGGGAYFLFKKPAPPKTTGGETTAPGGRRPGKAEGEDAIARAKVLAAQGNADEALKILATVPDEDPKHDEVVALIDIIKRTPPPTPSGPAPSAASLDEKRLAGLAALKSSHYIEAVTSLDPVVKAHPDDTEAAQGLSKAREQVAAMGTAVKAYNEQDFESAIRLLWDLRKQDAKNQDVEEYLFKSYFNSSIQDLQAGNFKKASQSLAEATQIRSSDVEAQRHLKFAKKYAGGANDLLSKIYVRHLTPRP